MWLIVRPLKWEGALEIVGIWCFCCRVRTADCVRGKTSSNSSLHVWPQASSIHEIMEHDKIKQTKRRSSNAHARILILHASFKKSGCPRVCQIPHGGPWRGEEHRPSFFDFSPGATRFSHGPITLRPLSDSWGRAEPSRGGNRWEEATSLEEVWSRSLSVGCTVERNRSTVGSTERTCVAAATVRSQLFNFHLGLIGVCVDGNNY